MKKSPFDYVNAINKGEDLDVGGEYNQFLINRAFSYFLDTVAISNEVNQYSSMDNDIHFDYMRSMISKKKRVSKWHKPKTHSDASVLSRYYNIPMREAYSYLYLFNKEELNILREQFDGESNG